MPSIPPPSFRLGSSVASSGNSIAIGHSAISTSNNTVINLNNIKSLSIPKSFTIFSALTEAIKLGLFSLERACDLLEENIRKTLIDDAVSLIDFIYLDDYDPEGRDYFIRADQIFLRLIPRNEWAIILSKLKPEFSAKFALLLKHNLVETKSKEA